MSGLQLTISTLDISGLDEETESQVSGGSGGSPAISQILLENGDRILLESGDIALLESS